jgi:tRNA dimethylallyltransferase
MFARGWVEEVRGLLARGGFSRTALQAAGYRQIVEQLERGIPQAETLRRVKQTTWRIARKQMTWLRHLPGVVWCDAAPGEPAEILGNRLYKQWSACHN